MSYTKYSTVGFFRSINTGKKARDLFWRSKFNGKPFLCSQCQGEEFYQFKTEPEIRKCKHCGSYERLRVGTVLENSKITILKWARAIFLVMEGKRGISAKELERKIRVSYPTAWSLLKRIRRCLQQRDELYKLKEILELDGAFFGKRKTRNQAPVLVAIETKDWIDERKRLKPRAGFVKICVSPERRKSVQEFVGKSIQPGTMVNTDGGPSMRGIKGVDHDYQVIRRDSETIQRWLPWAHKFISNVKAWILGTHHGVSKKYLGLYLSEYAYRFNRRHDPDTLFHRALVTCLNPGSLS